MGSIPSDLLIAEMAAEQHGVLSATELLGAGLTRTAVSVRARNGRLHRLHSGIYAVGHSVPTRAGRFLAAIKACGPMAALSHLAAAALCGYYEWDDARYPEVTVCDGVHRLRQGIVIHRTNSLPPQDVMRIDGIPVTTPARTLVDLAGRLEASELRMLVRRAQGVGRLGTGQLAAAVVRLRPRRGISKLREIVAQGPAPTRTVLEDVVLDLILSGGFARPDVNKPLWIKGRKVIPDFRWPTQNLIVEADGAAWHDNELARTADAGRQALLESCGERVLRVTWDQALLRAAETLDRIAAAGAPAASTVADYQA